MTIPIGSGNGRALLPIALVVVMMNAWLSGCGRSENVKPYGRTNLAASRSDSSVELSPSQLGEIKIEPVETHAFSLEEEAVGHIAFDGNRSVPVFSPYQGTIVRPIAELGDEVEAGGPLYTLLSADLIQAESALIGASAGYDLAQKELARVRDLYTHDGGLAAKDMEHAVADERTAAGVLQAARAALHVFGKTEADIDRVIASRQVDGALVVRSPIAGEVTARNAQPGLLVQPGSTQAPYAVADVTVKWMLADVSETDTPLLRVGQPVDAHTLAYPSRVFHGRIAKIYPEIDPNTHRATVRATVADPMNELRPGMLANFAIQVKPPVLSPALPENGVVREGNGAMTAWVTVDRQHFTQRVVTIGLRHRGWVQILSGLKPGELAVTDGAIFLDNMSQAPSGD